MPMKGAHLFWPVLAFAALASVDGRSNAGDIYDKSPAKFEQTELPKLSDVQALSAYPAKIALKGSDDAQQIILTASLKDNRLHDLTTDIKYEVADSKIVRVTTSGRVIPLANGSTEITAAFGD